MLTNVKAVSKPLFNSTRRYSTQKARTKLPSSFPTKSGTSTSARTNATFTPKTALSNCLKMTYTIKSLVNEGSIVNLKITQVAPAFQVGTDGTTYFGPDAEAPWGSMRHAFWPRNKCEGSIVTKDGPVNFNGNGLFVYAIQGMKPHHAAAKWKFADFQGPNYSAVMMEFTTPPSYGSTVVTVGGLVKDGEIITAGSSCTASHQKVKEDPENEWPEPEEVSFEWEGKTKDGKDVDAVLAGPLNDKIDRIDVMFHVPGFVKKIVAGAAGTKPYIYQVRISYSSSAPILTTPLVLSN
jgi:hypothetical protein